MDRIIKTFIPELKNVNVKDNTAEMIVSTQSLDRMGDVVLLSAWKKGLSHFKKHPVLLSSHNYGNLTNQIGMISGIGITEEGLNAKMQYFVGEGNQQADWGWKLVEKGIAAYSVGFKSHSMSYGDQIETDEEIPSEIKKLKPQRVFKDVELLEISQVLVPANAEAVQNALKSDDMGMRTVAAGIIQKGLIEINEKEFFSHEDNGDISGNKAIVVSSFPSPEAKGVVPYKETPKAPEDAAWNAAAEMTALWGDGSNQPKYAQAHTWFDSSANDDDKDGYPDVKGAYKLPHHDRNLKVVWRGVAAAMAALLGARGGVDVGGDKTGVYSHLKKHYAQFDKTPPDMKSYETIDDVLEGCKDVDTAILFIQQIKEIEFEKALEEMKAVYEAESELKAGAVLSGKNKDKLMKAQGMMMDAHSHIKDVLASAEKGLDGDEDLDIELEKIIEEQIKAKGSEVQTILFEKSKYSVDEARKWLNAHNFKSDKVDSSDPNVHRFRQFDPALCDKSTYGSIRFKDGITGVVCVKKKGMESESYIKMIFTDMKKAESILKVN